MRYLFYFVHPAKFHLFRRTINELKNLGHQVDICINAKDMLEDLVKSEGWEYTCLFPNGRRIKGLHTYLNAIVNSLVTIYRLAKFTYSRKRYDLYITDDLLTILGRIKNIPTFMFTDDDLSAVPETSVLLSTAKYVLCPNVIDIERYGKKKIGFDGYKALGHLHPNTFTYKPELLLPELQNDEKLFFIRCVSATSTHDVGKKGMDDELLHKIIDRLKDKGRIMISAQREIPTSLRKYVLNIDKKQVAQYMKRATMFIGDSNSMCYESAVLGIPAIEVDEWYSDFTSFAELNEKYGLMFGYSPKDRENVFNKIDEIIENTESDKDYYLKKQEFLLSEKVDLSAFMINLFGEFPGSIKTLMNDPSFQKSFTTTVNPE
jgi:uncharacterized protein